MTRTWIDDKNLSIRKRLFLTATPRHYNPHDRDRDGEARLLFSMDIRRIPHSVISNWTRGKLVA